MAPHARHRRFKLESAQIGKIKEQAIITLFGKRRTGKSTAAMYIVSILARKIDRFIVISGNKDTAADWEELVPSVFIHGKSTEPLQRVINFQEERLSVLRARHKKRYGKSKKFKVPRDMRVCVVIDDCGDDFSFMNSPVMMDITANGRHYGMDLIILCQYFNQLGTKNRNQIDYVGHLYTDNMKSTKKVYEEFVGKTCNSYREFECIFSSCTKQIGQLCWIDNTVTVGCNSPEQKIFFKKIPNPDDPKNEYKRQVGSRRVREYAARHSPESHNLTYQEIKRMEDMTDHFEDRGDRIEVHRGFSDEESFDEDDYSAYSRYSKSTRRTAYSGPMRRKHRRRFVY